MTTTDPTIGQPAVLFTAALQELAETYPTDPDSTATVTVTVADPAMGEQRQVELQPGQIGWLTTVVMDELATSRRAHADGTAECEHCGGRAGR